MKARRFEAKDFGEIGQWAKEGFNSTIEEDQFPKTGFIVDGLAAYFLYLTDSSVCFLENLISNKSAPEADRQKAINLVIEATLKEATRCGFKIAFATTNIPSVVFKAVRLGAHAQPKHTLLTKKLTHQ